jgi:DNA uptake protein ComE-like DNA-binding protein
MRLFAVLLVAGSVAAGAQTRQRSSEDVAEYLPPGDGKAIVAAQCASCHELNGTIQLRKSKAEWEAIVIDMVGRGAPLTVEEADTVVAYLSTVFSPSSPPLVDVNAATKADLVKLPGMTSQLADRVIAHRTAKGPLPSREAVRGVLGLDEPAFSKMKWYLKIAR